ncbi:MAG: hypothetical protein ABR536_06035, partial [Solirubrobacterales bacterium]
MDLKRPSLPHDIRFRATTRVKAVGYGTREQAWKLSRGAERQVEKPVRDFWGRRQPRTRGIVVGVAALVLAVSVVLHTPFPGVPCQVSRVKECAPTDHTLSMVPADALLYSHLAL